MTASPPGTVPPSADRCCRDADHGHCHGTYVRHHDDGECTDPGCRLPAEAHEHQVRCVDDSPVCGCAGVRVAAAR